MNLIKQILTDAKKQTAMVVTHNRQQKSNMNKIPTIEVEECQTLLIDEKIFEYDMIQRAREAEIILSQILANCK
jgi:hypothetical protein